MPTLEAQLTAITQEFVARIVEALRNASFVDVASLSPPSFASPTGHRPPQAPTKPAVRGGRQTAARRAEVAARILSTLRDANEPTGVRALSAKLGLAPDVLAVPLRELRAAGRIRKHGEKRNTTYSVA